MRGTEASVKAPLNTEVMVHEAVAKSPEGEVMHEAVARSPEGERML